VTKSIGHRFRKELGIALLYPIGKLAQFSGNG
jgi:hypothetical protein